MKRRAPKVLWAALAALSLAGAYSLGAHRSVAHCELRRSPLDGQTVEVWRDGELSDEWQPDDGAIYTMLDFALRDEMPPEALARYRQKEHR